MRPEDYPIDQSSRRAIIGTRVVEAIVIAALTAGATGYVALRVVEARADSDRESVQQLRGSLVENTRAVNALTSQLSAIEARSDERSRAVEMRLRALEERRR